MTKISPLTYNTHLRFTNVHSKFVDYFEEISAIPQCNQQYHVQLGDFLEKESYNSNGDT